MEKKGVPIKRYTQKNKKNGIGVGRKRKGGGRFGSGSLLSRFRKADASLSGAWLPARQRQQRKEGCGKPRPRNWEKVAPSQRGKVGRNLFPLLLLPQPESEKNGNINSATYSTSTLPKPPPSRQDTHGNKERSDRGC